MFRHITKKKKKNNKAIFLIIDEFRHLGELISSGTVTIIFTICVRTDVMVIHFIRSFIQIPSAYVYRGDYISSVFINCDGFSFSKVSLKICRILFYLMCPIAYLVHKLVKIFPFGGVLTERMIVFATWVMIFFSFFWQSRILLVHNHSLLLIHEFYYIHN